MSAPNYAILNLWVIFLIVAAVITDVRFGRVYNLLTVPCALAGLGLNAWAGGWAGLCYSAQGLGLGLAALLLTLLLGQHMGGGDIKLLAALGALRGPEFLLHVLVVAVLVGGVLALGLALRHSALLASLRRLAWSLWDRLAVGASAEAEPSPRSLRFPYAVAIGAGALVALVWL